MKRVVEWMAVLLLTAALIAGCAGGTKETAEKKPAPQDTSSPRQSSGPAASQSGKEAATGGRSQAAGEKAASTGSGVTEQEIDSAEATLVLYFDAVVNHDTDLLAFLQADTSTPKAAPTPKKGTFASLEDVKVIKALVKDGVATVYFEVKVDLGPSPGGAWSPGVNQRWAEIVKTSDGWKVKSMTTSPPNL